MFILGESIDHIEDLPPERFVQAVRNMSRMIATEKLDGSNLIVGVDNRGHLYTSREGKGNAERFYSTSDYTSKAADNGFKAAHAALNAVTSKVRKVLDPGEAVEIEVLFGRQPNAIVYGSNCVAFLRTIPGDNGEMPNQNKVNQLHTELHGDVISVEVPITTTQDGITLTTEPTKIEWKFTSVSHVDQNKFKDINVEEELREVEQWFKENPPSSFKTKKAFKKAFEEFSLPIKEKLLDNIVRKLTPVLRDVDVSSSENFGVEGVVLLDPETGKQIKIVDKSVFMLINQFNYAIRNQIKGRGVNPSNWQHLFLVFDASIEPKGASVYDDMLERISQIIGIPELSRYMNVTRTLKKFNSLEEFINSWNVQSIEQAKAKIIQAIEEGLNDLEQTRERFIREWEDYTLKLKSGREINYTSEIKNRTLVVFAETRQEMLGMIDQVQNAQTLVDVANALFGKQLKAVI